MKVPENTRLYLASASPRRIELLAQIGLNPEILPQNIDESVLPGESPADYIQRMSREKAASALQDPAYDGEGLIIAADTSVVQGDHILGKPSNRADFLDMFGALSGASHHVMSAVALVQGDKLEMLLGTTRVNFRQISLEEMMAYWESGEPADKAGGFGIQGLGALFVTGIEGSYSNVVGLPLYETAALLEKFGITAVNLLGGK